jgi:hypothetical protein
MNYFPKTGKKIQKHDRFTHIQKAGERWNFRIADEALEQFLKSQGEK